MRVFSAAALHFEGVFGRLPHALRGLLQITVGRVEGEEVWREISLRRQPDTRHSQPSTIQAIRKYIFLIRRRPFTTRYVGYRAARALSCHARSHRPRPDLRVTCPDFLTPDFDLDLRSMRTIANKHIAQIRRLFLGFYEMVYNLID
jgi:hypothetical protein